MTALIQQKCFFHETREAAARCPVCRRSFCHECVVEHEDRLVCTSCLKQLRPVQAVKPRTVPQGFAAAAGFLLIWLIFYYLGEILMALPSSFHMSLAAPPASQCQRTPRSA